MYVFLEASFSFRSTLSKPPDKLAPILSFKLSKVPRVVFVCRYKDLARVS